MKLLLKKLETYSIPKQNELMKRYKYFTTKQDSNETFDTFYEDLRNLIKSCNFEKAEGSLLRTQIVLSINDKNFN